MGMVAAFTSKSRTQAPAAGYSATRPRIVIRRAVNLSETRQARSAADHARWDLARFLLLA